jgi:hypothetical protein
MMVRWRISSVTVVLCASALTSCGAGQVQQQPGQDAGAEAAAVDGGGAVTLRYVRLGLY